jgi:hypothetical protein
MDHSHLYVFLYGLAVLATIMATLYGIYRVVSNLYQQFLDFSRRFRGVE